MAGSKVCGQNFEGGLSCPPLFLRINAEIDDLERVAVVEVVEDTTQGDGFSGEGNIGISDRA